MRPRKKKDQEPAEIMLISSGRMKAHILGAGRFVFNAVSYKARCELLDPMSGRKTKADYAERGPKHNPPQEYRDSMFLHKTDLPERLMAHSTRLMVPRSMIKGAIETAALDMPGVTKAGIQRLTWVEPQEVDFWGIPQIYMDVVRNADGTPDIRTRACVTEWACEFTVCYAVPLIRPQLVPRLLIAAGIYCGIGDGRQETGYGNGQFELVQPDDKRLLALKKQAGRVAQERAIESPESYDVETARLLSFWLDRRAREKKEATLSELAPKPNGKRGRPRAPRSTTEPVTVRHAD